MRRLTDNEIKFIKETGGTPTLVQIDYTDSELERTPVYSEIKNSKLDAKTFFNSLARNLDVDLDKFYEKTCNDENSDSISLEYEATYLLYTFFTKEELVDIDTSGALKGLQDFKYYKGFRKGSESLVELEILEALEIYAGTREFYEQDGEMGNREVK